MSESGEVLKEALQTARSEADILDALAAYMPMAPETAQKEAGELLKQLPSPYGLSGEGNAEVGEGGEAAVCSASTPCWPTF